MDNASVEVQVVMPQDSDSAVTTADSADQPAKVSSCTVVNSGCVWENVHRPLPSAQPRWWGEWAF
jgi:hypothetical protein